MSSDDPKASRMRRRGGTDELRAVEQVMTALPEVFAADLSPRQRKILEYIRETVDTRGYPPTVREIGENFGIKSPNGVMCHLKALEKKGLILREDHAARAIQLVHHRRPSQGLPYLGIVAAGAPIAGC